LLGLSAEGYDAGQRLDFDLAVMDWWDRFDNFRKEQRIGLIPASQRPGKNQAWLPAYNSDADILTKRYGLRFADATGQADDPIVAALTDDELWESVDGWDA
jgi:hypothetical protein